MDAGNSISRVTFTPDYIEVTELILSFTSWFSKLLAVCPDALVHLGSRAKNHPKLRPPDQPEQTPRAVKRYLDVLKQKPCKVNFGGFLLHLLMMKCKSRAHKP